MQRTFAGVLIALCVGLVMSTVVAQAQALNMDLVGSYNTPGEAIGVVVSGSLAYVADEGGGFRIIDVSNPAAPQQRGALQTAGVAQDVAVSGNYAYLAAAGAGLRIIDVSNPT
jgi:hypothetical protein